MCGGAKLEKVLRDSRDNKRSSPSPLPLYLHPHPTRGTYNHPTPTSKYGLSVLGAVRDWGLTFRVPSYLTGAGCDHGPKYTYTGPRCDGLFRLTIYTFPIG